MSCRVSCSLNRLLVYSRVACISSPMPGLDLSSECLMTNPSLSFLRMGFALCAQESSATGKICLISSLVISFTSTVPIQRGEPCSSKWIFPIPHHTTADSISKDRSIQYNVPETGAGLILRAPRSTRTSQREDAGCLIQSSSCMASTRNCPGPK